MSAGSDEAAEAGLQVLTFCLGTEVFAIETEMVREVLDTVVVTEVPGSRLFITGLINVRGKVVPVIDLKAKFGMGKADQSIDSRIVVVEIAYRGDDVLVGIMADRVHEVTELAPSSIEDAPRLGMTWRPEFIRAIGKRGGDFIIVMNTDQVFASEESLALRGVTAR